MVSPFFPERADFLLEGPRVARLLIELPIGFRHGGRPHESRGVKVLHRLFPFSFPDSIADPGGIDALIDDQMSDVDILRAELARRALRDSAQAEFCCCKRRVSAAAPHAGGGAGEQNRSPPPRYHLST